MDRRATVLVGIAFAFGALAGCLGASMPEGASTGGADDATEPAGFTDEGLPIVPGVGDGASVDLGDRVLWFDETAAEDRADVVVNLTLDGRRDPSNIERQAFVTVQRAIQATVDGDRRLEPPRRRDLEPYRVTRAYLADVLALQTDRGVTRQRVHLLIDGQRYNVSIGEGWAGGPVVDPDDPPHNLTVRESLGGNATVALRRNGANVLDATTTLDEGTVIHTFRRPGNYTVTIERLDGTRLRTSFTVELDDIADCNAGDIGLAVENGTLTSTERSELATCIDPAD